MAEGNGLRLPFITPPSDKHSQWAPLGHLRRHTWQKTVLILPRSQKHEGQCCSASWDHPHPGMLQNSTYGSFLSRAPRLPLPCRPPPHLRPGLGTMSALCLAVHPEWLPAGTGIVAAPGASPEVGRPQATPHQDLGLNQTQPKGLRITSPAHLVWFPLLKKGPFSAFSLPIKHSFAPSRRPCHAIMLHRTAEHIQRPHSGTSVK